MDITKSGICHHMLFQTKFVKELFAMVELEHNGELFYNVFLKTVTEHSGSGASEYDIYFNFILHKHPDEITLRKLNWENTNDLNKLKNLNYDYLSFPYYMN
jgi:hypothetical protein